MVIALAVVGLSILILTWVGYPMLVALLATDRSAPRGPLHAPVPSCSVVLASREESSAIEARLTNLFATDYPGEHMEVVVALDSQTHTAGLEHLVVDHPNVTVVRSDPPGGKACALNAAVRAANGQVLVFADTFQEFEVTTIPHLVGALQVQGVGAASGRLVLPPTKRMNLLHRYWDLEVRLRENEAAVHSSVGVFGPVHAMRRDCWEPLPPGLILDDLYGPMRVVLSGKRVTFVPEAVAHDLREPSASREYYRKVRTLAGNIQLLRWLPAVLDPRRNPIWLFYLSHKLLRFLSPYSLALTVIASLVIVVQLVSVQALTVLIFAMAVLIAFGGKRLRHLVSWGLKMQQAVVVGTFYGLMGEWDIWRRQ